MLRPRWAARTAAAPSAGGPAGSGAVQAQLLPCAGWHAALDGAAALPSPPALAACSAIGLPPCGRFTHPPINQFHPHPLHAGCCRATSGGRSRRACPRTRAWPGCAASWAAPWRCGAALPTARWPAPRPACSAPEPCGGTTCECAAPSTAAPGSPGAWTTPARQHPSSRAARRKRCAGRAGSAATAQEAASGRRPSGSPGRRRRGRRRRRSSRAGAGAGAGRDCRPERICRRCCSVTRAAVQSEGLEAQGDG